MKKCNKCNEEKPLEAFYIQGATDKKKEYVFALCKDCYNTKKKNKYISSKLVKKPKRTKEQEEDRLFRIEIIKQLFNIK
jgi:hypothetical protein